MTAMGKTGMDKTEFQHPSDTVAGIPLTVVLLKGKLYAETLEGAMTVKAEKATLKILDPVGNVLAVKEGVPTDAGLVFELAGDVPGVQYHLIIE